MVREGPTEKVILSKNLKQELAMQLSGRSARNNKEAMCMAGSRGGEESGRDETQEVLRKADHGKDFAQRQEALGGF